MPQLPDTPFTKAKRKRESKDFAGRDCSEHTDKAARTPTDPAPNQHFTDRLKSNTISFPTPSSLDHMSAGNKMTSQPRLLKSIDESPTPIRFIDRSSLNPERDLDLSTTILELLHSDSVRLKASTELQLRHEIRLQLNVGETKLRAYEETISELRKRIDDLETSVLHLTS